MSKIKRVLFNFIRAQSDPYPGAFTFIEGREMRIWRARLFDRPYYGTPGQIGRISDEGLYVLCGDQRAVILQEVEMSGKRGPASMFVRSIKHRVGRLARGDD